MSARRTVIYAATIWVLVIMACGVLVVFVLPNYVNILQEFKGRLPLPTSVLIAEATLVEIWLPVFVAVGAVATLAMFVAVRMRRRWQRRTLIPLT